MSILYFKHVYPRSRIIGFEPDPAIFPCLQENMGRNGLADVQLVQAAVAGRQATLTFYSDGKYGSCLADHLPADVPESWQKYEVPCVRLRDYLTEPVDFLKMNVEGRSGRCWRTAKTDSDRCGRWSLSTITCRAYAAHSTKSSPCSTAKALNTWLTISTRTPTEACDYRSV